MTFMDEVWVMKGFLAKATGAFAHFVLLRYPIMHGLIRR